MSTNISNTERGPRRSSKKPHHGGQHSRSVMSDNDAYVTLVGPKAGAGEGKSRQRRKSHAARKGGHQHDSAIQSDGSAQRHPTHPPKTQATPIKSQAYAGPTFHQSPAASALPIPSFYSKSVPTVSPFKNDVNEAQSPQNSLAELAEPPVPPVPTETKRESTPLDFLFDAARKANATPGTESPNHRHHLSSANTPASRSPAPREGDADFPFELDSGDQATWDNTSTNSTPYKDRIEAARTQRTPSAGGKTLNEEERKAKTAALKQFLMHSAQAQAGSSDDNPFNARPAPTYPQQYGRRSNPSSPYHAPSQSNAHQYFPSAPAASHAAHYQSPGRYGPTSNLRNVYQPRSDTGPQPHPPYPQSPEQSKLEQPRISTARDNTPARLNFADIYNMANKASDQGQGPGSGSGSGSGHRATPSAQQLEDDLRKFLKLDLASRV